MRIIPQALHGVGSDKVHVAVVAYGCREAVDTMRLAYVKVLADKQKPTVISLFSRAVVWFNGQVIECRPVMSDNRPVYVSKTSAKACRTLELRHTRTSPYTPRTNSRVERFIQTLCWEWVYVMPFRNSEGQNRWVPRHLAIYQRLRKHSSLSSYSLLQLVELLC